MSPPRRNVLRCSTVELSAVPAAVLVLVVLLLAMPGFAAPIDPRSLSDLPDDSVAELCARIGGKLGSVTRQECLERTLKPSGGLSVKGAPILQAEYPPLPSREPLGRILLLGGIHGDEYSSVSVVFKWLKKLDRNHSGLFHWRVVPLLNPDGLLRAKSQRMNENGVDLNRNFPSHNWHEEAEDYWVRRTSKNPRRYPGTAPLSEPESKWLYDEIDRFRPTVIVSVHAPSHVVDYDGPKDPPKRLGPLYLNLMGTYPGSLGRFAGVLMGLPVVTIELPSAGIMPSSAEQTRIWNDLVRYLRTTAPDLPRIWAEVADSSGDRNASPSAGTP